jgi:hypothetical protein
MNEPQLRNYIQLLLFLAFVIPAVMFFLTQQNTLKVIHPLNRRIPPHQVWFQLIPIFGLVWQFWVIIKISDSIRNELYPLTNNSIFPETTIHAGHRPTYNAGILYAGLFCLSYISTVSFLPLFTGFAILAGTGAWITYWVQLSRYKKQLKERAL